MKLLAILFAVIALIALLFGFTTNVIPLFSVLGKAAALIALAGFTVTAIAYMTDEWMPSVAFDVEDIHP